MFRHLELFDTVRDAIFIADAETGMIADANTAAEALCGRTLAELRSLHHTRLHPPECAEARQDFEKDTRVLGLTEGLLLHKDGRRIPVEITASHLTDSDGKRMMVGIFRDTTERDQMRESLRQSEERFRQIAESAGEFIWELDAHWRYTYCSSRTEKLWGIKPEEMIGKTPFDRMPAGERRRTEEFFAGFARSPRPFSGLDVASYDGQGRLIVVEVGGVPFFDREGALLGFRGISRDITDRKRAEQALHESEDLYRTLFEQSADSVFLLDLSAGVPVIVAANEAAVKSHGYSREEMIGQPLSLIEPGVSKESLDARMRLIAAGQPFYMVHRRKDGSTFEVESAARLVRIGAQEVLLAVGRDITLRKQAEEALQKANDELAGQKQEALAQRQRFFDMLETLPVMVCQMTPDYHVRFANRAFREKFGESDGRHCYEYCCGFDKPCEFCESFVPLKTGRPHRWEFTSPDGRAFIDAYDFPFTEVDGSPGILEMDIDVTERKRAEEALRRSEAQARTAAAELQAIMDAAPVSILIAHDAECRRISGNRAAYTLLRQPPGGNLPWVRSTEGRPMNHRLLRDGTAIPFREVPLCAAALTGQSSRNYELTVAFEDGTSIDLLGNAEPLLDGNGQPQGSVAVLSDITERKQAERASRQKERESFARQKLESLGTLAGGIAHDFNNLLGAVLAQTELAMAELATGSRPDEHLTAIRDVAIRGSEIVRQLMVYAGRESDILESVEISKVVQGMLGLLKVAISRHATLVTNLSEDLPAVRARTGQLSQIVMNLVVNASEAIGDRDGVIRVSTEHIAVGQAEAPAEAQPPAGYVQLAVSDTGRGMSPETKARVLEPFFTTKFSGRGLGLAMVHGIVRSLGGAIEITSELGKGSTFEILLPCEEAGAKPSAGHVLRNEESAPPAQDATVLIVEDEEELRLAEAKMLRKSGFKTVEAASGSVAIDLLRTRGGEIDLLLLDLTIPGSSSQEVVAEAARARPDVKIILTSAYSEQTAKAMMRTPVVRGFIRKPFRLGELVQTLRNVLASRSKYH